MVRDEVERLVVRAKAGDRGAMGTLIACYRPLLAMLVARWAHQVACQVVDDDDLWQEAYREFLELVRNYRIGSAVAFGVYLRHTLGWRLSNYMRAEQRRVRNAAVLNVAHLDFLREELKSNVGGGWENPRLRAAFRRLSPRQRGVLVRMYVQDRAASEVAAALGLTTKAVQTARRRAERKLRRTMDSREAGGNRGLDEV